MKCPAGSYAQLDEIGKKLVEFRDVKYNPTWRARTGFVSPIRLGEFKALEVRAVDFIGGGNVMIDDYAYQGKMGVPCKAFLFRFVPIDDRDRAQTVRFTFDDDDGFLMDSERNLREDVEQEILDAFDSLIIKLRQEKNCRDAEEQIQYPCTVLAKQILAQSSELKKSVLLNYTISMHTAIKDAAYRLRDPKIAEDRVAMWTLVINEKPFEGLTAIVCNMQGKYIDCLRAAVCFKQVHHLMFALPVGTTLSDHIYLLPTLTAYSKDFIVPS